MKQHTAYLSVGSNMGDKSLNCRRGIAAVSDSKLGDVTAISPFYRTEPVDYLDQDWFVNAVFCVATALDPWSLFGGIKAIEQQLGRPPDGVRFGPRVLDLDIILYDELILDDARLTIPHSRMHKRRFVLQPICDIAPQAIHPVLRKNMRQLLDSLAAADQGVILLT